MQRCVSFEALKLKSARSSWRGFVTPQAKDKRKAGVIKKGEATS